MGEFTGRDRSSGRKDAAGAGAVRAGENVGLNVRPLVEPCGEQSEPKSHRLRED